MTRLVTVLMCVVRRSSHAAMREAANALLALAVAEAPNNGALKGGAEGAERAAALAFVKRLAPRLHANDR
eukprot:1193827-Prorocentrum_minimum.AAC.2